MARSSHFNFIFDEDTRYWFQKRADAEGRSLGWMLNIALRDWARRKGFKAEKIPASGRNPVRAAERTRAVAFDLPPGISAEEFFSRLKK
jgi:hypothetical protein